MIEKERFIQEMHDLNHFHDDDPNTGFNYQDELFNCSMSPYMFGNETFDEFLELYKKCSVWMIESVTSLRNYFDLSVDKYYDRHNS